MALGSNIGDRVSNIRRAVGLLENEGVGCRGTGRMYESEPMYVEDQARFVNTVIEVCAPMSPSRHTNTIEALFDLVLSSIKSGVR